MIQHDRWSRWLLERRDGGNERQRAASVDRLAPIRDRVLDAAEPLDARPCSTSGPATA